MSKKFYRFFGGLLLSQEKWLNKMAASGFKLIRTTKCMYEFEECNPGQYQYCVEFIGYKSKQSADDYANFLENLGYHVFFKNINLNYSIGKVEARPWAEQGGKLATSSTTLHRELFIVEKTNDGKKFELHTTYEDKLKYYKNMRKPWLFLFLVSAVAGVLMGNIVWGVFASMSLIGLIVFQIELNRFKKQGDIKEW